MENIMKNMIRDMVSDRFFCYISRVQFFILVSYNEKRIC